MAKQGEYVNSPWGSDVTAAARGGEGVSQSSVGPADLEVTAGKLLQFSLLASITSPPLTPAARAALRESPRPLQLQGG